MKKIIFSILGLFILVGLLLSVYAFRPKKARLEVTSSMTQESKERLKLKEEDFKEKSVSSIKEDFKSRKRELDSVALTKIANNPWDNFRQFVTNYEMTKGDVEPAKLEFVGYDTKDERLAWLSSEDYENLCQEFSAYLGRKGIYEVTKATIVPEQTITYNDWDHSLFIWVDYYTESTDQVGFVARCDTYKEFMRFFFESRYGEEAVH